MQLDKKTENTLNEYEDLKIKEKQIKDQLDLLKVLLRPMFQEGFKINTQKGGKFELKKRDNWKFNKDIIQREEDLKEEKADEIAKGNALNHPTFYINYSQPK